MTTDDIKTKAKIALDRLRSHGDERGRMEAQADLWNAVEVALQCIAEMPTIADAFGKEIGGH